MNLSDTGVEKKGNKIPGRERQKGKPNLSRTDLRFFQKRAARGDSKRQGTTVSGVKQIAQRHPGYTPTA